MVSSVFAENETAEDTSRYQLETINRHIEKAGA